MKASSDGCGCFPTGRHYPGIAHLLRIHAAGVANEHPAEADWYDLPVAVLDTETTGRDHNLDRVIEIGIVIGQSGKVLQRFNWLINPERPIPEQATQVHGISDDDVKDSPPFQKIVPELLEALKGAIPLAYNASFDRNFVLSEFKRCGINLNGDDVPPALRPGVEWLDPLVWARHIQKQEKSKTLSDVAARLGISLEGAHRASNDAEATLQVMYALGNDDRMPKTYGALIQEQRRLGREQEREMARWRRN
jgi:DNA polymerase III subunit epsilon